MCFKYPKVFAFNIETDGEIGSPFIIAALVYAGNIEVDRIILRTDIVTDKYYLDNIVPKLTHIPITNNSYQDMLLEFSSFYNKYYAKYNLTIYGNYYRKVSILKDMFQLPYINDRGCKKPIDLSELLFQHNYRSVEDFNIDNIPAILYNGGNIDPLDNCFTIINTMLILNQ